MGSVSLSFLFLFLPAVFAVFRLIKIRYANLWLLLAGLACYSLTAPKALPVLLLVILISYVGGIANSRIRGTTGKHILSGICIALLAGLLILFRIQQMSGTVFSGIPGLCPGPCRGKPFFCKKGLSPEPLSKKTCVNN